MKALAIVCLLAGTAAAERPYVDVEPERREPEAMLGFGIGGGSLPGRDLDAGALDVELEHELGARWRIAGQYEYLWVGHRTDANDNMLTDGSAHRITLAFRHSIVRTRILLGNLRFFVDGELGAGMMLGKSSGTTMLDTSVFAGIRAGYDLIRLRDDTRASPVWEPAIWFRALSTGRDLPVGWLFGIGVSWGG